MKLATAVGIPAAEVAFQQVEGIDYLLIERYDRRRQKTPTGTQLERLHQEDFCQALGISSQRKYQSEGARNQAMFCFDSRSFACSTH